VQLQGNLDGNGEQPCGVRVGTDQRIGSQVLQNRPARCHHAGGAHRLQWPLWADKRWQSTGDSMSIDTDTARKVAKLARIRVEEADLPALAAELSGILGFMEQLNEVDVTGIEPMTSVTPMRLKRRADVVTDGNIQVEVLKNAPDTREGFFAVPKVVE